MKSGSGGYFDDIDVAPIVGDGGPGQISTLSSDPVEELSGSGVIGSSKGKFSGRTSQAIPFGRACCCSLKADQLYEVVFFCDDQDRKVEVFEASFISYWVEVNLRCCC